jgi:hypothetical protein
MVMKNLKSFLFMLVCLLIASCGKSEKVPSTFSLSLGSIVSGAPQYGGILISGRMISQDKHLQMAFRYNEDMVIELDEGVWEFAVIAWEGDSSLVEGDRLFTGRHSCAYAPPVELSQADATVNLSLAYNTCADTFAGVERFSDASFMKSSQPNQFREISLRSCSALPTVASGTSCTSAMAQERGLTGSYRIEFGFAQGDVQYSKPISSRCLNIDDQDDVTGGDHSYLNIPAGASLGAVFSPMIRAYTDDNCSGDEILYVLGQGLYNGISVADKNVKTDITLGSAIDSDSVIVFFEHNPNSQTVSYNSLFGYGNAGIEVLSSSISQTVSEYKRLTGINSLDPSFITVASTAGFSAHDEFLWLVNEEGATVGCGSDFVPGIYSGNRIKNVVDATTFELYGPFNDYYLEGGSVDTLTIPTNLANPTNTIDFCSIQMVRVANNSLITISSPGTDTTYDALAYDKANGYGGVLAIKAKVGVKTISSGAFVATLSANEKGRVAGDTFTYAKCPSGKRCAYLGNGGVDGAGGGIVMVTTRKLGLYSSDLTITANAHTSSSGLGGTAGTIVIRSDEVEVASGKTLLINAVGGNGTSAGGDGGYISSLYCGAKLSNLGTITPDVSGGTGTAAGVIGSNVQDSAFCPY